VFINHFDEGEIYMKENRAEKEMGIAKNSYQSLLRQFRASNEEIISLKDQLEFLKEKKEALITTNNLILQELEKHHQKEKIFRNVIKNFFLIFIVKKLNILEGKIIQLRAESQYYKSKYREAEKQYKEERIGNENDLLQLKRMLSE